eukprot:TRINITY_DN29489_c0_g1_i1.p1 TRINITY_DN29489_c0_g1~~TRINITY_DN29489_c0_g1_i1.p1  ORF type:complete len:129 (+),score=16.50 TRINITY_DN29489_c0_g1_i1:231-617(+)
MACVAAFSGVSTASSLVLKSVSTKPASVSRVQGLPSLSISRVVCSAERKPLAAQVSAASIAAASAFSAHPALALVDERLSTEGTGLSLGLSNPALGWILVGVFAGIWALYFAYSSSLPEGDDDSGLSL